jgi:fructose-1-phosphate kinase PfkB-like protein
VGGKGNNVARALQRLGRKPRPVTFLGGSVGVECESLLRADDGLDPLVVRTQAPTRVILTVRTEESTAQTAFFDPDPSITAAEADALARQVDQALRSESATALTLSGSSPAPSTHGLYSDLVALALARKIPVFLDTYGPALDAIWGFWPTAVSLNRREAASHLRKPRADDDDVVGLLRNWHRHGVACGVITDGANPVSILLHGKRYRAIPPAIQPINPIGSGDALLAGLVHGWLDNFEPERLCRHAIACAVANALVWDAGAIEAAEVSRWQDRIVIERDTLAR